MGSDRVWSGRVGLGFGSGLIGSGRIGDRRSEIGDQIGSFLVGSDWIRIRIGIGVSIQVKSFLVEFHME